MKAALEAAGLSSAKTGHRYTDEDCFNNMLTVWTHYGRPPRWREMGKQPSQIGPTLYVNRFGSWKKAIAAFIERVNTDMLSGSTPLASRSSSVERNLPPVAVMTNDKRNISLGLRFKVLHRDRFKCILCGMSPSSSSTCKLHVDHIMPWSKGGLTVLETLRSLCDVCNIGRSNRYVD
jgi:hypothetical protein